MKSFVSTVLLVSVVLPTAARHSLALIRPPSGPPPSIMPRAGMRGMATGWLERFIRSWLRGSWCETHHRKDDGAGHGCDGAW